MTKTLHFNGFFDLMQAALYWPVLQITELCFNRHLFTFSARCFLFLNAECDASASLHIFPKKGATKVGSFRGTMEEMAGLKKKHYQDATKKLLKKPTGRPQWPHLQEATSITPKDFMRLEESNQIPPYVRNTDRPSNHETRRATDALGWWLETWPEFWYQRLMITLLVVGPLSMSLLLFWYHLTRMTDFGKTVLNVVGLVVDLSVLTWVSMAVWKHPNVDLPEWPIEVDQEKQKLRKLKDAMKRLPVTVMTPKKDELAQRYLANLLQLCKDKNASSIAELSEEQKEEAMLDAHAGWLVDQLKKAKEIEAQDLQPVKAEVEKALLELEEDGNSSADDEDGDLPTSLSSPSQSSTAARAASEFQEIHIPLRKKAYYFIPFAIVIVLVRLLLGALAVIIFSIASPAEKVHWVPLAYLIAWTTFTGVFFGNHLADLFVIWRRITAKYIDYLLEQNPVKRYKKVHPPKLMTIFVRELDRWCHYHRHFLKAPYLMILPLVYGFVFAGELASKWNTNGVVFVDTFVFFSDLGLFVSIVIILVFQCFITTELHRLAGYFMTLATSIKEHQLERRHWQSYYLRSFNSNSLPISPTTLATMSSLLVPLLTVGIVSGFRIYFMPSTAAGCCKCTNATAIDI